MGIEKLEQDLAGFGKRVNEMSNTQARHDERIADNKEAILQVRVDVKGIYLKIDEVKTNIWSAVKWVIGIVAVPTLLVLYQLIKNQTPPS